MQFRKTISLSFFVFLFFQHSTAMAVWFGEESKEPQRFTVLESKAEYTRIQIEFLGFDAESLMIEGSPYHQLVIPGLRNLDNKGYPSLPKWNRNILIPNNASAAVNIEAEEVSSFRLHNIAPSKGPIERNQKPSEVPYEFSSYYASGTVYPAEKAVLGAPFRLRHAKGVNLQVAPLQVNNVTGEVTLTRKLIIRIDHAPLSGKVSLLNGAKKIDHEFFKIYADRFINFAKMSKSNKVNHIIRDTGRILVISHENFLSGIQPLLDWRRDTGMWHKIVSLASLRDSNGNVSYSAVKALIQNEYDSNQISYVLLVGDVEFLPTHPGEHGNAWGEEADPKYALVEGVDSYPDLFVSRFSVKTAAELATIVNKTLRYEQTPELGGAWYAKATGVASEEGSPRDWERANILRDLLMNWHYTGVDQIYEPNDHKYRLVDALNEGRGFINYIGHGSEYSWVSTGFDNQDILNLQNGDRVPVIVSVACVNGDFGYWEDTFAELWLKAGSANESKGALAIFASSTNQSWVPPTVGQQEITRLLVTERMHTVGALMFHGSIAVLEDASSTAEQTFETWHIFGDGNAEIRTRAPSAINFNRDIVTDLKSGTNALSFAVGDPGIRIGLVRNDHELIGSGLADESGMIHVDLLKSLQAGDSLRITLTGFNRIPVVEEFVVE